MKIKPEIQKVVLEIAELALNPPELLNVFFGHSGHVCDFNLSVDLSSYDYSESLDVDLQKAKRLYSESIYLDHKNVLDSMVGVERLRAKLLSLYAEYSNQEVA